MVRLAWDRDVVHYSVSLAAVQGGVFLAQLVVARLLVPRPLAEARRREAAPPHLRAPESRELTNFYGTSRCPHLTKSVQPVSLWGECREPGGWRSQVPAG